MNNYYSIVVPVYNSEKTLEELYSRIKEAFDKMRRDFELILVDDSSRDGSYSVIRRLAEQDERVIGIQLARNSGQHNALMCGLSNATGSIVITIDDDLQHPPEEIGKLTTRLEEDEDLDVVIGSYDRKKHSFIRNFGSKVANLFSPGNRKGVGELEMTSFRAIRQETVRNMLEINITTPRIGFLILEVTNHVCNVKVHHDARKYGESQYTFSRLVKDLKNNILTNSLFPLIALRNIGISVFFLSTIMAIVYLIRYFAFGVAVKGWITIILLTLVFSGLILFGLGILGEYVMRVLVESQKKPNYYIRKRTR